MPAPNIETIVSLSKRRGFVFPASDIYGGLGSSWDYGPLGVELANNIKKSWWNWLVYERDDIEGLDSSIIQNRNVWKYSGHETTFSDPLVDCRDVQGTISARQTSRRAVPESSGRASRRGQGMQPDRSAAIQPDVPNKRRRRFCRRRSDRPSPICGPKRHRGFSSISRMC